MEVRPPASKWEFIPRPPPVRTMTDFIVVTFVTLVVIVLVGITALAVWETLFGDKDVKPFFVFITDLMGTITAALIGFLAGRGVGHNGKNGRSGNGSAT